MASDSIGKSSDTKKLIYGIATISSTVIGVGLFSLPYVAARVGIWTMLAYFLILGFIVILINYFFGELSLKTPDFKRMPGFAEVYFGKKGKILAIFTSVFGCLGAILAYIIIGGEFLRALFYSVFPAESTFYVFIYCLAGSFLVFLGIKAISKVELWGLILLLGIFFLIFIKGFSQLHIENLLVKTGTPFDILLPFGPIIFSLWAGGLIPEAEEMLKNRKDLFKKAIVISLLIPLFLYIAFTVFVLGITGENTTESALLGLKGYLGNGILTLGIIFGLVATFTSFITVGLTLKKVLWYDLKLSSSFSWAIISFVPFILFLLGVKDYIPVISFVGGVTIGIDGILILLMHQKVHKKKLFVILPLILILFSGIIYQIIYFLR